MRINPEYSEDVVQYWGKLRRRIASGNWDGSVLTAGIVAIAVFVLIMTLAVAKLGNGLVNQMVRPSLSVYLDDSLSEQRVAELADQVRGFGGVKAVEILSKETALKLFRQTLGKFSPIAEGLEVQNPLPRSLEVQFLSGSELADKMRKVVASLEGRSEVSHIGVNDLLAGMALRLKRPVLVVSYGLSFAAILLAMIVVIAAVRLRFYRDQEEVEILSILGADPLRVITPFIQRSLIECFAGAALALIGFFLTRLALLSLFGAWPAQINRVLSLLPGPWALLTFATLASAVLAVGGTAMTFILLPTDESEA